MNPANRRMNDLIRGRAGRVMVQAQQAAPAPQIANANAGNGTGNLPAAPADMNQLIRRAAGRYYPTIKGR
jgi:hypothetical protein